MFYFLIGSYLLGSISSAIIICKMCNLPDPRTKGSKNPGATNVLRIGGKFVAAFVLLFDGFKGVAPVLLAHYFGFDLFELTIILLCAFLGHVFPIYYGFKGGKGVATYLGGLIGLNFFVGLTFSIIWLIVAKVMKVSSIAALSAFNPIYYMMDAFRLGFLGIGSVELWKAFLVPISMIIVLTLVANALLNRGVSIKTE